MPLRRRLPLLVAAALLARAQDFAHLRVEQIASHLHYAEGPAWSPEGFLLFSDAVENKIYKFTPGQPVAEFAAAAGGPLGTPSTRRDGAIPANSASGG